MTKPNIFRLATKELSQDAFFTWLLQWADKRNRQFDIVLNEIAQDFVRLLIGQSTDYQINKVEAGRQWNNIDIWAEINDEYFIGIEDKTNTCEHSEQLKRYKKIAESHYKIKAHKLVFVYLKTGNESSSTLKQIVEKGYLIINRQIILSVLTQQPLDNQIFNDFKDYLLDIENQTNSYTKFENITNNYKAGEGFYIKLQEHLNEETDWRYVANQTGGFLGFWYHWTETPEYSLYIQIENAFKNGIKVVIKIGDWKPNINTLYQTLTDLEPYARKYNLTISKPEKFRAGETSTLAVVQNNFTVNNNGQLDINTFLQTLKNLEQTLDEYTCDKNTAANIVLWQVGADGSN